MAVLGTDIQFWLSGGASNTNPNLSLGGARSTTTQWAGGTLHDLFDAITGDENAAMTDDYRCVYIRNGSAQTWGPNIYIWFSNVVAGGADLSMGLDPAGVGGTATTIATQTAVPLGVTFTAPTNKLGTTPASSTITLGSGAGTVAAGQAFAVWIKRHATASAAANNDGATITVEGDTAA